jgi:hypothetical protein
VGGNIWWSVAEAELRRLFAEANGSAFPVSSRGLRLSVATNELADDEDKWDEAKRSKDTSDHAATQNRKRQQDCGSASARNCCK